MIPVNLTEDESAIVDMAMANLNTDNPSIPEEHNTVDSDNNPNNDSNASLDSEPVHTEIFKVPEEDIVDESSARYSSADWFNKAKEVSIGILGCGGIGSWATLLLSRISPKKLILYDNDFVEDINLGGQFFGTLDCDKSKTDALYNNLKNFSPDTPVISYNRLVNSSSAYIFDFFDIAITGFDNMGSRKTIYNMWKRQNNCKLLIDGRLNAEEFQIFCLRKDQPNNMKIYEDEYLFPDSESESTICSFKQTSYCAAMIGSFITNIVVNWLSGLNGSEYKPTPFITRYMADTMFLETVN